MSDTKLPDAWLRGPIDGVPPLLLPAAHAFVQVAEDVARAAAELPPEALWSRPGGDGSLEDLLKEQGVIGISDVDTRKLVRHIRDHGA